MPTATAPSEITPNSQYDDDSAPNQNVNCGPTTVTNELKFHLDTDFGIEATRNLATSRNGTGTTLSERKTMFDRRGVPSSVHTWSPSQVKAALNGHKGIDLALQMDRIPVAIRVRPFPGSHSVEAIAAGVAVCPIHHVKEPGIWVFNPDFHPERGQHSRYFYPDHAWIPAYKALGSWCVVPDKDKVITTRIAYRKACHTQTRVRLRSGPSTGHSTVKTVPAGYGFTSIKLEKAGGWYVDEHGTRRRDWLSLNLNGRLVWCARGFVREG